MSSLFRTFLRHIVIYFYNKVTRKCLYHTPDSQCTKVSGTDPGEAVSEGTHYLFDVIVWSGHARDAFDTTEWCENDAIFLVTINCWIFYISKMSQDIYK